MMEDSSATQSKARLSYILDLLATAVALTVLVSWISDIHATVPSRLSQSFIRDGFCLSPALFDNTHLTCAFFNAVCAVVCVVAAVTGFTTTGLTLEIVGMVGYFLSHSYGHYSVGLEYAAENNGSFKVDDPMEISETFVLAIILSIGPIRATSNLIQAQKISKTTANILSVTGTVIMVAIYQFYIQRRIYTLLYINVSILLTSSLPGILWIGYTSQNDIAARSSRHNDNTYKWFKLGASLLVIVAVFSEPFFCDSFIANLGGHLLFDISLALDAFVKLILTKKEKKKVA